MDIDFVPVGYHPRLFMFFPFGEIELKGKFQFGEIESKR